MWFRHVSEVVFVAFDSDWEFLSEPAESAVER